MAVDQKDVEALIREKYAGDRSSNLEEDLERLEQGEPLAYVIGHIPFLGLSLDLSSHPLIPRPETEWWVEKLIAEVPSGSRVLDLCAGSGAIGLALLKHTDANVSFGELDPKHTKQIQINLERNKLDASRADIRTGDLFTPFAGEQFDLVVSNPPYIPVVRELEESVERYEPKIALRAGDDGLSVIRRIAQEVQGYLSPGGVLWMECDIENIEAAEVLLQEGGALRTEIQNDQYGRPRLVLAWYP